MTETAGTILVVDDARLSRTILVGRPDEGSVG